MQGMRRRRQAQGAHAGGQLKPLENAPVHQSSSQQQPANGMAMDGNAEGDVLAGVP